MTGLCVGPRDVDEMDVREMNDLLEYWGEFPPVHIGVERVLRALGVEKKQEVRPVTAEEFASAIGLKLGKKG